MTFAEIILQAQSPSLPARLQAESRLKILEETQFALYMVNLAKFLSDETADVPSRHLASLLFKNAIYAMDPSISRHLSLRYIRGISMNGKEIIRTGLLTTLNSDEAAPRRGAALALAKLAHVEVGYPNYNLWPELIPLLLSAITSSQSKDTLRSAALETVGIICEDSGEPHMDLRTFKAEFNEILKVVIATTKFGGVDTSNPESIACVQATAHRALSDMIQLACHCRVFMSKEGRETFMNTFCDGAASDSPIVCKNAFDGLTRMADSHFDFLADFMKRICSLAKDAIASDVEMVALSAIELWSTIAEEEHKHTELIVQDFPTSYCCDREETEYVEEYFQSLLPVVLDSLRTQKELEIDDDTWNRFTASVKLLEFMCKAATETALTELKSFVASNIESADWRYRDASMTEFGCILDGLNTQNLRDGVRDMFPLLLERLRHESHVNVVSTLFWTLGKAVPVDTDMTVLYVPELLNRCIHVLNTTKNPILASNVCICVLRTAKSFEHYKFELSGPLENMFEVLFKALLSAADREDSIDCNLRNTAYETIAALLGAVSRDCTYHVRSCLSIFLQRLHDAFQTLSLLAEDDDDGDILDLVGNLCSVLGAAIARVPRWALRPFGDSIMEYCLRVACIETAPTTREEGLRAINTFISAVGSESEDYLAELHPVLKGALSDLHSTQVFEEALTIVSLLSRCVEERLVPYSDVYVPLLLNAVKSSTLDRSTKILVFRCLATMAYGLQEAFIRYVPAVMTCMIAAAKVSMAMEAGAENDEILLWLGELRQELLVGTRIIISSIRNPANRRLFVPYVSSIAKFCRFNATNKNWTTDYFGDLHTPSIALMTRLAKAIPSCRKLFHKLPWFRPAVNEGVQSPDPHARKVCLNAWNYFFSE